MCVCVVTDGGDGGGGHRRQEANQRFGTLLNVKGGLHKLGVTSRLARAHTPTATRSRLTHMHKMIVLEQVRMPCKFSRLLHDSGGAVVLEAEHESDGQTVHGKGQCSHASVRALLQLTLPLTCSQCSHTSFYALHDRSNARNFSSTWRTSILSL